MITPHWKNSNNEMITKQKTLIRAATSSDQKELANLIHFEVYVHRHLDWRPPLDWVGSQPFLVSENQGRITAALACPPDHPEVSWIRMFAVSSGIPVDKIWLELWEETYAILADNKDLKWVAAIPIHGWFKRLLVNSDYHLIHRVVMLSRDLREFVPQKPKPQVSIRPMNLDDLINIQKIDRVSFVPVWQISSASLELAFRQAAIATVAEEQGEIVGYQISTSTPMGGHLARLAVKPKSQGKGIGSDLLYDLLIQFERRGARALTVNTQQDNPASLALYEKAGFLPTGEHYPIYQLSIP
jgi:ribosomal-protein-alanine N-acetyltransferase